MSQIPENPYSAPIVQTSEPIGDYRPGVKLRPQPLATRWQRFAGSVIDSIVLVLGIVPPCVLAGVILAFVYPEYLDADVSSPVVQIIETVVIFIFMLVGFLVINGYLLAKRGQTVGKYLMKTRIVSEDDQLVSLPRVFIFRYLILWLISLIPIFGRLFSLADALAIFRENRKCIHDDICKTKVVMVESPKKSPTSD